MDEHTPKAARTGIRVGDQVYPVRPQQTHLGVLSVDTALTVKTVLRHGELPRVLVQSHRGDAWLYADELTLGEERD